MMVRHAVVRLNGGLGNQLFQYHLAAFLSIHGWDVTVDGSASALAHDRIGVRALRMPLPIRGVGLRTKLPVAARRVVNALQVRNYRRSRTYLNDQWVRLLLKDEVADVTGRSFFDGDFQFAEIVERVRNASLEMRCPELVAPTDWFLKTAIAIKKSQPWAVHVRRGDFTVRNGILTLDYYAMAIDELQIAVHSPGLLFSDDPQEALDFLRPLGLNIEAVYPSSSSPAAESMLLMASCNRVIGSNSTFSWWSALWSESLSAIPAEFFPYGTFTDADLRARELDFQGAIRVPASWL